MWAAGRSLGGGTDEVVGRASPSVEAVKEEVRIVDPESERVPLVAAALASGCWEGVEDAENVETYVGLPG